MSITSLYVCISISCICMSISGVYFFHHQGMYITWSLSITGACLWSVFLSLESAFQSIGSLCLSHCEACISVIRVCISITRSVFLSVRSVCLISLCVCRLGLYIYQLYLCLSVGFIFSITRICISLGLCLLLESACGLYVYHWSLHFRH